MRKLIVTRGPQGAGKTTFVRSLDLFDHLLSADRLREIVAGPVMKPDGRFARAQEHDSRVWRMLMDLLERRMRRGELLVVDATHPNASSLKSYRRLAERHRYEILVVDFSTVPLERCLLQNVGRPELEVVPEEVLRHTWRACHDGQIPADLRSVSWSADGAHLAATRDFLDVPVRDLSSFEGVLHIGDLQGCAAPLVGEGGLLEHGLLPGHFHIFVGDLCDRGIENDRVVQFLASIAGRDDVAILWGNHEDHLHAYAQGRRAGSREFSERTAPQLVAAHITPEQVGAMLDHTSELLLYRWHDTHVLVTHAGLPVVPEHPARVSTEQLGRGPGRYHERVDEAFSERAPEGWFQVHGHRNQHELPILAGSRSFNLEGSVEFGGHLRAVSLDASGWTPIEIRNRVFRSVGELARLGKLQRRKQMPPWVGADMPEQPRMPPEVLAALMDHELIRARPSPSRPHISALNFTRDAFFDRRWDALNTRARGLFVDTERQLIAARSYDKFFNVGERPETRPEALEESLVFPVTLYAKENGYLGIVGYDEAAAELFCASKSSLESEHAGWLQEQLEAALGDAGLERLRRYLRDAQCSFVFEVIEPVRDPHIVAYSEQAIILLDVVRRAVVFERMPYPQLVLVSEAFGLPCKQRGPVFEGWAGLSRFLELSDQPDWTWRGRPVEGFVLEDSAGFQTKLKLDYYSFWKRMRSVKDRVLAIRGTDRPLQRNLSDERSRAFHAWCIRQPDQVLSHDIITLRRAYLGEEELPAVVPVLVPVEEAKEVAALRRALDGVYRAWSNVGAIKSATAERLVMRILSHPDLLEVARVHAVLEPLLEAAPEGLAGRLRVAIASTPAAREDEPSS